MFDETELALLVTVGRVVAAGVGAGRQSLLRRRAVSLINAFLSRGVRLSSNELLRRGANEEIKEQGTEYTCTEAITDPATLLHEDTSDDLNGKKVLIQAKIQARYSAQSVAFHS